MPKSASTIATDLISTLQKSGNHTITIPWPDMYDLCDRERFKETFLDKLKREITKKFFLITYGQNVVVVCQDTNFSEVK